MPSFWEYIQSLKAESPPNLEFELEIASLKWKYYSSFWMIKDSEKLVEYEVKLRPTCKREDLPIMIGKGCEYL